MVLHDYVWYRASVTKCRGKSKVVVYRHPSRHDLYLDSSGKEGVESVLRDSPISAALTADVKSMWKNGVSTGNTGAKPGAAVTTVLAGCLRF
jgi:hypothetical protein